MPMTIEPRQLLLLLSFMSPTFPTGSFAYSHGLEWAIADGSVGTADELTEWISDLLARGSGWNDAVLFSQCWSEDLGELNELALAMASSRERYLETTQLGRAFVIARSVFARAAGEAADPSPPGDGGDEGPLQNIARRALTSPTAVQWGPFLSRFAGEDEVAYPVAAGSACFAAGIDKTHSLLAFLQGFSSTLVSVAVRLVPLGQTQGLETIRDLMPFVAETAERAARATLADLGSVTLASDIAAMKHETQPSRIFRS